MPALVRRSFCDWVNRSACFSAARSPHQIAWPNQKTENDRQVRGVLRYIYTTAPDFRNGTHKKAARAGRRVVFFRTSINQNDVKSVGSLFIHSESGHERRAAAEVPIEKHEKHGCFLSWQKGNRREHATADIQGSGGYVDMARRLSPLFEKASSIFLAPKAKSDAHVQKEKSNSGV
jgi:hypothetical protein